MKTAFKMLLFVSVFSALKGGVSISEGKKSIRVITPSQFEWAIRPGETLRITESLLIDGSDSKKKIEINHEAKIVLFNNAKIIFKNCMVEVTDLGCLQILRSDYRSFFDLQQNLLRTKENSNFYLKLLKKLTQSCQLIFSDTSFYLSKESRCQFFVYSLCVGSNNFYSKDSKIKIWVVQKSSHNNSLIKKMKDYYSFFMNKDYLDSQSSKFDCSCSGVLFANYPLVHKDGSFDVFCNCVDIKKLPILLDEI